jgi:hypothetical protein
MDLSCTYINMLQQFKFRCASTPWEERDLGITLFLSSKYHWYQILKVYFNVSSDILDSHSKLLTIKPSSYVYMPYEDGAENLDEFVNTLLLIEGIVDNNRYCHVILGGILMLISVGPGHILLYSAVIVMTQV